MRQKRQLWVAAIVAATLLVAANPVSHGAVLRLQATTVDGYVVSGSAVYVTVSNAGTVSSTATVSVQAVVNGCVVAASAAQTVAAGATASVAVRFAATPSSVVKVGVVVDSPTPF
jgi:subtilase family serine protease